MCANILAMNAFKTFKNWTLAIPYFFIFLIIATLVFCVMFNLGFDSFKKVRGLASESETQLEKGVGKVVSEGVSDLVDKKPAVHSRRASAQDQFLYGYLQGRYRAVYKEGELVSVSLKEGMELLEFSESRKEELAKNFQALFFNRFTKFKSLKNTDRIPASERMSFALSENNEVIGELNFLFSEENLLKEIQLK